MIWELGLFKSSLFKKFSRDSELCCMHAKEAFVFNKIFFFFILQNKINENIRKKS